MVWSLKYDHWTCQTYQSDVTVCNFVSFVLILGLFSEDYFASFNFWNLFWKKKCLYHFRLDAIMHFPSDI